MANYAEQLVAKTKEQTQEQKVVIKFTSSQVEQIKKITNALGLAYAVTINSAIKYAVYYAKNIASTPINQLKEFPTNQGKSTDSIKLEITPETWLKLEQAGEEKYWLECAIVGIQLFYEKLMDNSQSIVTPDIPKQSFDSNFGNNCIKQLGLEVKNSHPSGRIDSIGSINGKTVCFYANLRKKPLDKQLIAYLDKKIKPAEIAIILATKYTKVFEEQLRQKIDKKLKLHFLTTEDFANNTTIFQKAVNDLPKLAELRGIQ